MVKIGNRSKDEMFRVILNDCLSMYRLHGFDKNEPVTIEGIRTKLDTVGLLRDCANDPL